MEIDINIARKVLATVDAGLVEGLGVPRPGKMCVEAAVNYALGLPHGDEPACVAPSLRALKIRLNDSSWSSDKARAAGLRRLALIQLGSAGHLNEHVFALRVSRLAIRSCVPAALRAVALTVEDNRALLSAADLCERNPTKENANAADDAAAYAAAAAAAYAANAADDAAAYAAAAAAAYAATAAADAAADAAAAYAAAAADAAAAYAAADAAAAADAILNQFAENIVQILIEMKAPGAQWLHLTEVTPYFARPSHGVR